MNIDRLIDFNLFQNVVFLGIHETILKKPVCLKFTFLNYAKVWSQHLHLQLSFKRLSDEIGSRSHTCLGSIKIEFLLKAEHLFFSVKKTKKLFYFLGNFLNGDKRDANRHFKQYEGSSIYLNNPFKYSAL